MRLRKCALLLAESSIYTTNLYLPNPVNFRGWGSEIGRYIPKTSFEATKKWLEVNFPSRGKVKMIPQVVKTPFSQTLHFLGKQSIPRERESYFKGKIENYQSFPLRENSPYFPLEGKYCPKRCLGFIILNEAFFYSSPLFFPGMPCRRPSSIAGEIRVVFLFWRLSNRTRSRDQIAPIADVFCTHAISIAL